MVSNSAQIEIKVIRQGFSDFQEPVVQVYRDAYSSPPYNETEEKVQGFSEAWNERCANKGFLLVMAYFQKKPVGMAYGWSSREDSHWTDKLKNELGDEAQRWTTDNFEFVDFAVSPNYQGQGISSLLYKALFSNISHRTAILYTHQSETAAYNIYLKKGWEVLRRDLVFKSGKKFVLMGKLMCELSDI